MITKIQKYYHSLLIAVRLYNFDAQEAIAQCYGAVMFTAEELLDDYAEEKELFDWWENEAKPTLIEAGKEPLI